MDFATLVPYAAMMAFTPGPNNIIAMTIAGKHGFLKSLQFCLGVFLGFFAMCIAAAAFSALLFDVIPQIKPAMAYIGAAYMLYLAYTVVRKKPAAEKRSVLQPDGLLSGAVFQLINPKGILYSVTAMSTFVLPYCGDPLVIGLVGFGMAFLALAATATWALCGAALDRILKKHRFLLNIIMVGLLLYCAIMFLLP